VGFRTQAQVDRLRLPAGKVDVYVFDEECTGLAVRLQGRARRWVVSYQVNGTRRRITLGDLSALPLRDARHQAGRIIAGAREGVDAMRVREDAKVRATETLGALIEAYLEQRAKPNQRRGTHAGTRLQLVKRWGPLHDRSFASLTNRDIDARLYEIARDFGPGPAAKARAYLSSVFAWGMNQPRLGVTSNPVVGTTAPIVGKKTGRALSHAEMIAIWHAAGECDQFGVIIRLAMLTGARRAEIAGLPWSELDFDRAVWALPAARSKNGRALLRRGQTHHETPLSRQALELLDAQPRRGPFLFGRRGRTGFSGYSDAKRKLDAVLGEAVAPWTIHDIRHSVVTHMAEIGIAPHIIEAIVNHLSGHTGRIAGIYNHAAYREPKRVALQTWADWLEDLVRGREPGANVVRLKG
jgi:integrase